MGNLSPLCMRTSTVRDMDLPELTSSPSCRMRGSCSRQPFTERDLLGLSYSCPSLKGGGRISSRHPGPSTTSLRRQGSFHSVRAVKTSSHVLKEKDTLFGVLPSAEPPPHEESRRNSLPGVESSVESTDSGGYANLGDFGFQKRIGSRKGGNRSQAPVAFVRRDTTRSEVSQKNLSASPSTPPLSSGPTQLVRKDTMVSHLSRRSSKSKASGTAFVRKDTWMSHTQDGEKKRGLISPIPSSSSSDVGLLRSRDAGALGGKNLAPSGEWSDALSSSSASDVEAEEGKRKVEDGRTDFFKHRSYPSRFPRKKREGSLAGL